MECLSAELTKERSTREPSEDSQKTLVMEAKLTDAVQWLTELATLCFTLCLEELWVTTAYSLLSISLWT